MSAARQLPRETRPALALADGAPESSDRAKVLRAPTAPLDALVLALDGAPDAPALMLLAEHRRALLADLVRARPRFNAPRAVVRYACRVDHEALAVDVPFDVDDFTGRR